MAHEGLHSLKDQTLLVVVLSLRVLWPYKQDGYEDGSSSKQASLWKRYLHIDSRIHAYVTIFLS